MTQSTNDFNVSTEKQFEQFCSLLTAMPDIEPLLQTLLTDRHYPYTQRSEFMTLLKQLPYYIEKISQYPFEDYRFSPSIEAFITALKQCGLPLNHSHMNKLCVAPYSHWQFSTHRTYLMELLTALQSALKSPMLKTKRIEYQSEAQRNCFELAQYINRIFSSHSKLLVIRIDLSYIQHLNVFRFLADVHHFGHRALHFIGHLILSNSSDCFRVPKFLKCFFINRIDCVDACFSDISIDAFWVLNEQNRFAGGSTLDPLVHGGEESTSPGRLPRVGVFAAGSEDHKSG